VLTALCVAGDVAARTDGTEFVVLAVETDLIGVRALQTRLRRALRTANLHGSVGVATRRPREELTGTWARAEHSMHVEERRLAHAVPSFQDRAVP
jgi:GGDEF domain-containing protein